MNLLTLCICCHLCFANCSTVCQNTPIIHTKMSDKKKLSNINIVYYYMAMPQKDCKLPNCRPLSRFSHLGQHLDQSHLEVKKFQTKTQNINHFLLEKKNGSAKMNEEKKSNWHEQTLANLSFPAVRKQNVSWYKPVTLNELKFSCFHR